MPYAYHMNELPDYWPYGEQLRAIRGPLSVERASRKVGVDRQTWTAWEKRGVRPRYESLHAIVEAFGCPPDLIGFDAPKGWELVPSEWLRNAHQELNDKLDTIIQHCTAPPVITFDGTNPQLKY